MFKKIEEGEVIIFIVGDLWVMGRVDKIMDDSFLLSRPVFVQVGVQDISGRQVLMFLPIPSEDKTIVVKNWNAYFIPAPEIYSQYIKSVSGLYVGTSVPTNEIPNS